MGRGKRATPTKYRRQRKEAGRGCDLEARVRWRPGRACTLLSKRADSAQLREIGKAMETREEKAAWRCPSMLLWARVWLHRREQVLSGHLSVSFRRNKFGLSVAGFFPFNVRFRRRESWCSQTLRSPSRCRSCSRGTRQRNFLHRVEKVN
jgi:hypothetical protein